MWDLRIDGTKQMMRNLQRIDNEVKRGEIMNKMINGALPIYKEEVEKNLKFNLQQTKAKSENDPNAWYEKRTGKLLESVTVKESENYQTGAAGRTGDSAIGYVTFTGHQDDGERNAAVAAYMEYGYDDRITGTHVKARPFLGKAARDVAPKCRDKMNEIFAEEIKKKW
jgi:hypothetical protein